LQEISEEEEEEMEEVKEEAAAADASGNPVSARNITFHFYTLHCLLQSTRSRNPIQEPTRGS
jgi:hypothetical protein